MFVQNCWYVAAWDLEVTGERLHQITIINQPLVIYRTGDGELVAMEDRCCHRFAPLSKGRIEDGCNLRCLYHGLKFAPDGTCIEIPGQDKIPDAARVRTYPVAVRGGWIWVWMGNPARADTALVPPAIGPDHPDYVMLPGGTMDYKANYQLINDNLTDLSHVVYVHANSFGGGREDLPDNFASERPVVKVIDRGIQVSRWLPGGTAELKSDSDHSLKLGAAGPSVMYNSYKYLAPGVLLMHSGSYRVEDQPADDSAPTGEPLMATFTSQAVTPMTDNTTRYFFCWGPRKTDGGLAEAKFFRDMALKAFAEDREMIEAQQEIIDLCGPAREVLTSADVGPVQMRAVIRKLLNAEQRDGTPIDGTTAETAFLADAQSHINS